MHIIAVATFVLQTEDKQSICLVLTILKKWHLYWNPSYWMTDWLRAERNIYNRRAVYRFSHVSIFVTVWSQNMLLNFHLVLSFIYTPVCVKSLKICNWMQLRLVIKNRSSGSLRVLNCRCCFAVSIVRQVSNRRLTEKDFGINDKNPVQTLCYNPCPFRKGRIRTYISIFSKSNRVIVDIHSPWFKRILVF